MMIFAYNNPTTYKSSVTLIIKREKNIIKFTNILIYGI